LYSSSNIKVVKSRKNERGGICSTHGEIKMYFRRKMDGRDHLGALCVDGEDNKMNLQQTGCGLDSFGSG